MGKILLIFFIVSILLLNTTPVSAKSSALFNNYLTERIYQDCFGKDLHIKEPFINDMSANKPLNLLPWPYQNSTLKRIIELLGDYEPWDFFQGTCEDKGVLIGGSKDGCRILTCGDNKLDINQYTYFWNNERIDVPREEFKTIYGNNIETHGDKSPITTGNNSPINQEERNILLQLFWSKGTIGGAIIGFILNILYNLLKKKFPKRKN